MKFRLIIYFFLAGIVLGMLPSCGENPHSVKLDDLNIQVTDERLYVKNISSEDYYFYVAERGALAFIVWSPNSTDQNRIESLSSLKISIEDIPYMTEGAEYISFFYWKLEETNPEEIKQLIIPIRD